MKYIAALYDDKRNAPHPQLFSNRVEEIAEFAKNCNRQGMIVAQCVAELKDDATARNLETVASLSFLHVDIDVRGLDGTTKEEVVAKLMDVCPDLELTDSGRGIHARLHLKEPVLAGTPEYERACKLRTALTSLLCGDKAVDHSAALMRVHGTHNYKCSPPVLCQVIHPGKPVDLTDIEALLELYQRPLFVRRITEAEAPRLVPDQRGDGKSRVDVDAALSDMRFEGGETGFNRTELRVTASLLRGGMTVDMVVEEVLAAAKRAAKGNPSCASWDWDTEREQIFDMCLRFIQKNQELCPLLPEPHFSKWKNAPQEGKRATFLHANPYGWQVRTYQVNREENKPNRLKKEPLVIRPFIPFDPAMLPQREWLLGRHYQRRTVSCTAAPGGFGKTTLGMVEAVAMSTCRDLLGEQPLERLKVWIHNGEDNLIELQRRIAAVCQHYKIDMKELEGWLFLTSGNEFPLKVAHGFSDLNIDDRLLERMAEQIAANKIDVCLLDPLVTLHGVSEGDNMRMDTVVRLFVGVADAENCSTELAHHMRKPPPGGDSEFTGSDIRGASAIFDAVRSARVINRMSAKEARDLGFQEHEAAKYLRVDKSKGNYSPAAKAVWREFINVELPNGDDVGVLAPWNYPGQGMTADEIKDMEGKSEQMFMRLLQKYTIRGRLVNDKGRTYHAPALFAKEPEARQAKITAGMLEQAMGRLFHQERIRLDHGGTGGRAASWLVATQS